MRRSKELQVWQKAHDITVAVYKATQCFPKRNCMV